MNHKERRRALKIKELARSGVEPYFIAERFNLEIGSVRDIIAAAPPPVEPCAAPGCTVEPEWAGASIVGPLVFCRACAHRYTNNYAEASRLWPHVFAPIEEESHAG